MTPSLRWLRFPAALAALLAGFLLAFPAAAELTATTSLRVQNAFSLTDLFNQTAQDTSNTQSLVGSNLTFPTPYIAPVMAASAGYGVLRAASHAESSLPGSTLLQAETLVGGAWGQFSDSFIATAQNVAPGTVVRGTFRMTLDAALSYLHGGITPGSSVMTGSGTVALTLNVAGDQAYVAYNGVYGYVAGPPAEFRVQRRYTPSVAYTTVAYTNAAGATGVYDIDETIELTTTFVIGQPTGLSARLDTSASAHARGASDALEFDAAAGNTALWGGIADVQLLNGDPVLGFSAIGVNSGVEFAAPVPLPAPIWLFLSGLATVIPVVRRRLREAAGG